MKHPSSAKVFELVEKLQRAIDKFPSTEVDMMHVEIEPSCGTPGCHAGWAYVAINPRVKKKRGFMQGVVALNEFFGFDIEGRFTLGETGLEMWAEENPELWGNRFGNLMFADHEAFGQRKQWFAPKAIIDHWRAVGERLLAREAGEES